MTKARFLANGNNKIQLIALLRNALEERGYGVRIADDDADTLVVRKALGLSVEGRVFVHAEDTDIVCMLVVNMRVQLYNIVTLQYIFHIFIIIKY